MALQRRHSYQFHLRWGAVSEAMIVSVAAGKVFRPGRRLRAMGGQMQLL
jgi:hypothetical protein